jgi:potassium efflux system protein
LLKNKVSVLLLQAKDNNSEIGYLTISMKNDMWGNENIPLLQDETDSWDKTITEMFTRAFRISGIVLAVYLVNSWQNALPAILMLVFLLFWSYANLRRIKSNVKSEEILGPIFFLKDSVLAGCLVLFFSFLPFFFRDPQMALLHLCEFLRLLALSYLIFPYLSKKFKPLWILLCIIWIYFALDDLLLEESYVERWLLMIFDVALIYLCTIVFRNTQKIFQKVSNSPATKLLTIFSLSLTSLSIILNLTGRVTLAKMFGIASIQSLVVGVTIKVICKVILEFIYLQAEAYQDSRLSLFINFKVLEIKLGKVLWFFAVLFWFAALLVDFDLFTSTLDIIIDFLDKSRSIGNMNFTYNNVFVFVGIIYLSSLLSAFVNFFFGHEISKNPTKKSNIGSILLLIRLAIWALGFVIAVAAAGIPIDKISILLGALGVGIGFGLQHITNNLVSGIVLAFERPIQIGDQIEVSGKIGVVNEIGVRSSKIKSVDGSDIIIPNGDLLSQHLINWTQQNRNKRMNFVIGISYDSNLLSVTEIIKTTLENNEDVLETPAPAVLVQNFAASAIEISIYFWVADLFKAPGIKSKVMIDVFDTLGKNNIQIPFPIVTVIQENKTEE